MNKRKIIPFIAVSLVFTLFLGCVKNTIDDSLPAEIEGLTVPESFTWSTIESAVLTVTPEDTYEGAYYYLIEVFSGNPVGDTAAVLLARGVAHKNQPFVASLDVPAMTTTLYVRQTSPLKLQTVQSFPVDSNFLVCDFASIGDEPTDEPTNLLEQIAPLSRAATIPSTPTPTNALVLNSNLNNPVTLSSNRSYVIPTGNTYTGKITFSQGSSLYIEGLLTVSAQNLPALASGNVFVVQSTGQFTVTSSGTWQLYSGTIYNYGKTSINALAFTSTAIFNNAGELLIEGLFSTTNSGNKLINDGQATIKEVSLTNGTLTNNGTVLIDGQLYTNGAVVTNSNLLQAGSVKTVVSTWNVNCGIHVTGTLLDESGSTFTLKTGTVLDVLTLNASGSLFKMAASSQLVAETVTFNSNSSTVSGTGSSYALCRFGQVIAGTGSYKAVKYTGRVEIECSNHYQGVNQWNPFYTADSKVRWATAGNATTSIATTSCNGEGVVVSPPYPTPVNPDFPLEVPLASVYTFIMEDNWPAVADYDMNDLVVRLSFKYNQNSSNKVTNFTITYTLVAVGAKKSIAAAVQLDEILPDLVSSISYGKGIALTGKVFKQAVVGYEDGQSRVILPFFDDAHAVLAPNNTVSAMLNTYIDGQKYPFVTNTVTVLFKEPQDPSLISIMKLNFFIVTDAVEGEAKRTEIHLSGFIPSDKVDDSRFGKYYDNSVKGAWYTTPGNLVWGILVPTTFKYSAETKSIVSAYPDFAAWCSSGGAQNTYWYMNPTTNTGYIY